MDVITVYLYGFIDNDIYIKIPEGFTLPEVVNAKPRSMCSIKLQRSLYRLKQSGRMWCNRLSEYLLKEGYANNPIVDPQFCSSTLTFYPMGVKLTYRSHMGPLGSHLTLVGFRASSGLVCGPLSAYVVHFRVSSW